MLLQGFHQVWLRPNRWYYSCLPSPTPTLSLLSASKHQDSFGLRTSCVIRRGKLPGQRNNALVWEPLASNTVSGLVAGVEASLSHTIVCVGCWPMERPMAPRLDTSRQAKTALELSDVINVQQHQQPTTATEQSHRIMSLATCRFR